MAATALYSPSPQYICPKSEDHVMSQYQEIHGRLKLQGMIQYLNVIK
jgi:hypothetical protein